MNSQLEQFESFKKYSMSRRASWYWITNGLVLATVISIFWLPQDVFPVAYVRAFLGLIFVLLLPGFSLAKTLYPINVPIKTSSENLDLIERIILSIGMSIILTFIVGLVLNYSPWGLALTPETLALALFTVILALVAITREYQMQKAKLGQKTFHRPIK